MDIARYERTLRIPVEEITTTLGPVDAPIVFCDVDFTGRAHRGLKGVTLASNKPLRGYTERGGVFVREYSPEEIAKYQEYLVRALKGAIGYYRSLHAEDAELFDFDKFRMVGIWPSVEMIQEALGVDSEYAFVRPVGLSENYFPATDEAVVLHELVHGFNNRVGHEDLKRIVRPVAMESYDRMPRDFNSFTNGHTEVPILLDEGVAFTIEFAYLRKKHPDLWETTRRKLKNQSKQPRFRDGFLVLPYMISTTNMEDEFLQGFREGAAIKPVPKEETV